MQDENDPGSIAVDDPPQTEPLDELPSPSLAEPLDIPSPTYIPTPETVQPVQALALQVVARKVFPVAKASQELQDAYTFYKTCRNSGQSTDEAMEKLYPLVSRKVAAVVGKVLKKQDRDLIVTFTTDVLMAIDKFEEKAQFASWVEQVVRYDCLDEIRRKQSERGKSPRTRRKPTPVEAVDLSAPCEVCGSKNCGDGKPENRCKPKDAELRFQQNAHTKRLTRVEGTPTSFECEDSTADITAYYELKDAVRSVLTAEEHAILEKSIEYGYTGDEVAAELGIPAGTVRWKMGEIKRKIQQTVNPVPTN